jgi:hypothetical protein
MSSFFSAARLHLYEIFMPPYTAATPPRKPTIPPIIAAVLSVDWVV